MKSLTLNQVLLLDNVDPTSHDILKDNGIKSTLCKDKLDVNQLVAKLQDYEGVVVRSATKITSEIISRCPHLKIIGRAGTGVDNIDIKSATDYGILVMNTPGGNTLSAAEHTCTLICCLARNVPNANSSMKKGEWNRKAFMGHELFGKTLAIVGLGRIGVEVASRMQSFGMETIGFDPMVSKENAAKSGIEWLELEDIWPKADYITVHTPLIPQTKGLLNTSSFNKCKRGVRVVNCARGGIIDEDDLLEALNNGVCGGAALDVFVDEPTSKLDLVSHPNVIACPHLGASTREAQSRCGRDVAQQIVDVCNASSYFGVINAPALSQVNDLEVGSLCLLSQHLAKILSSISTSTGTVVVSFSDSIKKRVKSGIEASTYVGLLNNPEVNLINSSVIASKAGYKILVESCDKIKNQFILMKLNSKSVGGFVSAGSLFLDSINEEHFEIPVELNRQNLLLISSANPKESLIKLMESGVRISSINFSKKFFIASVTSSEDLSNIQNHLPSNTFIYSI